MDPLLDPIEGADRREIGGATVDTVRAGNGRVKRTVYPPGFRWSTHMAPNVETDLCMHAHVGFLASGEIHIEYADGCVVEHKAPQIVASFAHGCRPENARLALRRFGMFEDAATTN